MLHHAPKFYSDRTWMPIDFAACDLVWTWIGFSTMQKHLIQRSSWAAGVSFASFCNGFTTLSSNFLGMKLLQPGLLCCRKNFNQRKDWRHLKTRKNLSPWQKGRFWTVEYLNCQSGIAVGSAMHVLHFCMFYILGLFGSKHIQTRLSPIPGPRCTSSFSAERLDVIQMKRANKVVQQLLKFCVRLTWSKHVEALKKLRKYCKDSRYFRVAFGLTTASCRDLSTVLNESVKDLWVGEPNNSSSRKSSASMSKEMSVLANVIPAMNQSSTTVSWTAKKNGLYVSVALVW